MTLKLIDMAKKKLAIFRAGREENILLESADIQLGYLSDLLKGKPVDREKIRQINIGLIAVREIEGIDDELAELLYEIDYWVRDGIPMENSM